MFEWIIKIYRPGLLLAGRWQMCQRNLSQINFDQQYTVPEPSKHQKGPVQTTFLPTKTIPGVPRRLWPSFRKSEILTFLEIGQVTVTPRGSIGNFLCWPNWLKSPDTIWIGCFEAKDGIIKVERWPSLTHRPNLLLSLYWVKAKGSVGWSVANVLSQTIPDQH